MSDFFNILLRLFVYLVLFCIFASEVTPPRFLEVIIMDIVQSFLFSIGRCPLSLYEQRIMCIIVKHASVYRVDKKMKSQLFAWDVNSDDIKITLSVRDVLGDDNKHYDRVLSACLSLMSRQFSFCDPDSGNWFATPIIYNVLHHSRSGLIQFFVSAKLMAAIVDFRKGYRQYSLDVALNLPSPFAVRFYILMAKSNSPLVYSIDELKAMFGMEAKYSQTADFLKKVIVPAQKVLDDAGVSSFHFERIKAGTKVTALKFYPVRRDKKSENQLAAKISTSIYLDKDIQLYLMRVAGFSLKELSAHKVLLAEFAKINEAMAILADICNRAAKRGRKKGWIISAIRSELDSFKRASV